MIKVLFVSIDSFFFQKQFSLNFLLILDIGKNSGPIVKVLDHESNSLGSSPGQDHSVVFLGKCFSSPRE